MTRILTQYYPDMEANDNRLVMVPQWDGWKFLGYAVQKPNKPAPVRCETWRVE